jgi:hypothetical protein
MNLFDDSRLREIEEIIVSLQVFRPIPESLASERGLVQPPLLDHGAHGAIKDNNALSKQVFDRCHVRTIL